MLREITLWADTNHRNVHPFYGFATDKLFGPFGALVSPVSGYEFSVNLLLRLTDFSGVRLGMPPSI